MQLNKKLFIVLLFSVLFLGHSVGQNCSEFYQLIREGDELLESENPEYNKALQKYLAAKIAAKECGIPARKANERIEGLAEEMDLVKMELKEAEKEKENMIGKIEEQRDSTKFAWDEIKKQRRNIEEQENEMEKLLVKHEKKDSLMKIQLENHIAKAEWFEKNGAYSEALEFYDSAKKYTSDTLWIQDRIEYCKNSFDETIMNIEMELANINIEDCFFYLKYKDILDQFVRVLYCKKNTELVLIKMKDFNTVFETEIDELERVLILNMKDRRKNRKFLNLMNCTYFEIKIKNKNKKIFDSKISYRILLLKEILGRGEKLVEKTMLVYNNNNNNNNK